ncbi:accessory Sec system protein Asp2, partial [Streptococcus pneumoniae]
MSKDYKILQIGIDNWAHHYEIPENMDWYYFCPNSPLALRKMMEMEEITRFHSILIEDGQYLSDLLPFVHHIEPHTLFYNQDFKTTDLSILDLLKKRCAQSVDFSDPQKLL